MAYLFKFILVTFTIFSVIVKESESKPASKYYNDGGYSDLFPPMTCEQIGGEELEVCQRCAKQTKSPIVYPMCCANEDDVYNWCNQYTQYGKQS